MPKKLIGLCAILLLSACSVVTAPVKVAAKTVSTAADVVGGAIDVID